MPSDSTSSLPTNVWGKAESFASDTPLRNIMIRSPGRSLPSADAMRFVLVSASRFESSRSMKLGPDGGGGGASAAGAARGAAGVGAGRERTRSELGVREGMPPRPPAGWGPFRPPERGAAAAVPPPTPLLLPARCRWTSSRCLSW